MTIQTFWRACWMMLKLREGITTRKRERAARHIQASYRAWKARREYLAIRDLARRNRAATKMQCMFRARQARRELTRRQVVRRMGACESCRSQLATMYHFAAESELCSVCCDEFASLDDVVMETIDVNVYRRLQVNLARAQRAYRRFQLPRSAFKSATDNVASVGSREQFVLLIDDNSSSKPALRLQFNARHVAIWLEVSSVVSNMNVTARSRSSELFVGTKHAVCTSQRLPFRATYAVGWHGAWLLLYDGNGLKSNAMLLRAASSGTCKLQALKLEKQWQFNAQLRERLTKLAAQIAESERARAELHELKLQAARTKREMLRDSAVALEVASASCIQRHRAFRYSRAKRRLARLVDADGTDDAAATPASEWVELFDEASGYVYYYHTATGESVWERPPEMDAAEDAANENVGEWVEYWDENVGASYFYNVKTGEATWTTPAGYQSNASNQEDPTTAEAWPLENGGAYFTLPPRSKLEPSAEFSQPGNQHTEAYGDQYYAPYDYGGDQASQWGYNNNDDDGYYYYGDAAAGGSAYAYPLEQADNGENELFT
uniref:WW domain-containing protein n=1 Tax=Phytophthora ramorum TaxID=164328 RepID=H3GYB4_PHYRM